MTNLSIVNEKKNTSDSNELLDVQCYLSFDDMPLHKLLLRGIFSYGFEKPSAIQQRAIVPIINKKDIIAQAQSGTGKTGTFSIGLLSVIDYNLKNLQALVLSPTRELAVQSHEVISRIGYNLSGSNSNFCQTFVGGTRVQDDIDKIRNGCIVAVGTPGRVLDIMKRGSFNTEMMKIMILDEADEMLSQGFQEQIYEIFRFMPHDIQVGLFSATIPQDVLELSKKFMRDPVRILVRQESLTLDGIKQHYVAVNEENKLETLLDLYESISIAQSIVFVNTRRKVDYVVEQLTKKNLDVSVIHSDMPKGDREKVMKYFRDGHSRVLITTDLVARGIDVHHVNIVVNYDLPTNIENYLHRIGRGGRFGRKGIAINFISARDSQMLQELEAYYHTTINELPMNFASHLDD